MLLKPIRTKSAKSHCEGSLNIFIGGLWCGTAVANRNSDTFHFKSNHPSIITTESKMFMALDEICTDIELSLKEFINKIELKPKTE